MSGPTGSIILTDAKVYLGAYDISGDLNQVKIGVTPDAKEDSAFGSAWHTKKPGMLDIKAHIEGYSKFADIEANAIDGRLYVPTVGRTEGIPISAAAAGGDAGENGFFFKSMLAKYSIGGNIGDLLKFQCDAEANGAGVRLVRGIIMEDGKTSRTIAGNTATQPLGAVSATQSLYAVLHLLAFVGTNVTFTINSAVTDFATITQRAAFTQNTAVGSQYITPVAGAITDTFWRVFWTGTFTSFSAVVIVGIQ